MLLFFVNATHHSNVWPKDVHCALLFLSAEASTYFPVCRPIFTSTFPSDAHFKTLFKKDRRLVVALAANFHSASCTHDVNCSSSALCWPLWCVFCGTITFEMSSI